MLTTLLQVAVWMGLIGIGVASGLLLAHFQYLKRELPWWAALRDGGLIGAISGVVAGAIAQAIYAIGPNELLRVMCWGIAGGLLGAGLSFRIPNLGRRRGAGGGLTGGLLGGVLFIVLSNLIGQVFGRLLGVGAIGFLIGLMVVFAETAFREAWLEVQYGPRETRTVSLGSDPITIAAATSALCTQRIRRRWPPALCSKMGPFSSTT